MEKYVGILLMFVKAFAVGGVICTLAQIVINKTKLTAGRILVIFMLSGVVLEALGLYDYIVQFAGAGATVPISGFGYLLARGGDSVLFPLDGREKLSLLLETIGKSLEEDPRDWEHHLRA